MKKQIFNICCFLLFLLFALWLLTDPGYSSVVKRMTIEEMTEEAGIILQGKVTALKGEWNNEHNKIHTFVTISVTEYIKGDLKTKEITLRLLGGVVGDTALDIVGSPYFTPNEKVLLFLYPDYQAEFPIVGFSQGKFREETDKKTGEKIVKNEWSTFPKTTLIETIQRTLKEK